MKVVIDANRVMAALLRDGVTRRVIFTTEAALYAPQFLRVELAVHRAEFVRRSGLSPIDFDSLADLVIRNITWVGEPSLAPMMAEAAKALGHVDTKDCPVPRVRARRRCRCHLECRQGF